MSEWCPGMASFDEDDAYNDDDNDNDDNNDGKFDDDEDDNDVDLVLAFCSAFHSPRVISPAG